MNGQTQAPIKEMTKNSRLRNGETEEFIELSSVREVLNFLDSFEGYGMTATDEEQQVEAIRDFFPFLTDDYEDEDND